MLHIECVCKHGAGATSAHDLDVEQRFRRRPPRPWCRQLPSLVDFDEAVGGELALRNATGRNHEAKRLAAHDNAEVSAGAEHPAARVEAAADLNQANGDLAEL